MKKRGCSKVQDIDTDDESQNLQNLRQDARNFDPIS